MAPITARNELAGRIVKNAADRMGELAGLLVELVESPARAG